MDRMQGIDQNGGINLLDSIDEHYEQGSLFGDEND